MVTTHKQQGGKRMKWILISVVAVVLIAAGVTIGLVMKQQHNHQAAVTAKKAYVAKLQRAVNDSSKLDGLLYDTADRYASDLETEQAAQQDMAEVRGEITGSTDTTLLSSMLSHSQVMTRAVCQCSNALTSTHDLLAAYDAAASLRTDTDQLKGRITALTAEAK